MSKRLTISHIQDIRLANNAGMSFPVCKANAPLLDLDAAHWAIASDRYLATCKRCIRLFPLRYQWVQRMRRKGGVA